MTLADQRALERYLDELRKAPQTVAREIDIKTAEQRLEEGKAERTLLVIARQRILFAAIRRFGKCEVINESTGLRSQHQPVVTDSAVQTVWNAWSLAERLAHASLK